MHGFSTFNYTKVDIIYQLYIVPATYADTFGFDSFTISSSCLPNYHA